MIKGFHSPLGNHRKLGENLGEKFGEIFTPTFWRFYALCLTKVSHKNIQLEVPFVQTHPPPCPILCKQLSKPKLPTLMRHY
jgi:hypothetical protein